MADLRQSNSLSTFKSNLLKTIHLPKRKIFNIYDPKRLTQIAKWDYNPGFTTCTPKDLTVLSENAYPDFMNNFTTFVPSRAFCCNILIVLGISSIPIFCRLVLRCFVMRPVVSIDIGIISNE